MRTRGTGRRSGLDRRGDVDRRKSQRRVAVVLVDNDRRSDVDRRQHIRRSGQVRRLLADRRGRIRELRKRDRERARRLAEECMVAEGTAADRIAEVVARTWTTYPVAVRTSIANDLLPLLRPVIDGHAELTEDVRRVCVMVVGRRVGRIKKV